MTGSLIGRHTGDPELGHHRHRMCSKTIPDQQIFHDIREGRVAYSVESVEEGVAKASGQLQLLLVIDLEQDGSLRPN